MKQIVLANINSPLLPMLGLALFIALFVGILLWIYRKDSNEHYKTMENLPMNDGGQL